MCTHTQTQKPRSRKQEDIQLLIPTKNNNAKREGLENTVVKRKTMQSGVWAITLYLLAKSYCNSNKNNSYIEGHKSQSRREIWFKLNIALLTLLKEQCSSCHRGWHKGNSRCVCVLPTMERRKNHLTKMINE